MCFLSLIVIVGAIYFGNMFFGQYSLYTMLSLESMKRELNRQILLLKEQNAKAQKEYFELQGLDPDEKK